LEINISGAQRNSIEAKVEAFSTTNRVEITVFESAFENIAQMTLHEHFLKYVRKQRAEVQSPQTTIGKRLSKSIAHLDS
jgi:hypothetical protein